MQNVKMSTFFRKKNKCFILCTKGNITLIFYFFFQNIDNERKTSEIIIYVIFLFLHTKKPNR